MTISALGVLTELVKINNPLQYPSSNGKAFKNALDCKKHGKGCVEVLEKRFIKLRRAMKL